MIIKKKLRKYSVAKKVYYSYRKSKFILQKSGFMRKKILEGFYKQKSKKFQIASGEQLFKGWLNTDLYEGDMYFNATKSFPFKNNSLDKIYSHHFIEHITTDELEVFVKRCYKSLKKGGRVRFVTPDLMKLTHYYLKKDKELIKHYCNNTKYSNACEFFNMELRQLGEHIFIYDLEYLTMLLKKAGFKNIIECEFGKSDDKDFKGLDIKEYFGIDKISLAVEATK